MAEGTAVAPARLHKTDTNGTRRNAAPARPSSRAARRAVSASARARNFRPPEVVVGVLLVAGCALAAVLYQSSVDDSTTVVVAVRPIARGSAIVADDLGGVPMSGDTSTLVAGAAAANLLGQVATVDITAGVPLTPALVTPQRPLAAGEALTAIALSPGESPPDLAAGDFVRLVVVPSADGAEVAPPRIVGEVATVWAVDTAPDGVATIVTLRGSDQLAIDVAGAASINVIRIGET